MHLTKRLLVGFAVISVVLVALIFFLRKIPSTIHVERTLNARVAKVWQIWTDAESMKQWWSPKDFTAPVIKNEARVGGTFLFSMRSPKGEMFWNTGTYTEVVENQKIVAKFSFSDEHGNVVKGSAIPVPGDWPEAIDLIVEFKEVDGKTLVTVTEIGIPSIMKVFAKMGWEQQLDKVEALLK